MYDQKYINELAIRDQKNGALSEELWQQVKNVAAKAIMKFYIDKEEIHGLAAVAATTALTVYEPDRGNFSLAVHYQGQKAGSEFNLMMNNIVRTPSHWTGERLKEIKTTNPDGAKGDDGKDDAGTYWDSLGSEDPLDLSTDLPIIEKAIATLSSKDRALFNFLHVEKTGTCEEYAQLMGCSKQAISNRSTQVRTKLQKAILRDRHLENMI
jgi:hypothetical protein